MNIRRPLIIPKVNKILPTVYDDALSYYDVLGKMYDLIAQIANEVNSIEEDINSETIKYVNEQINQLRLEFYNKYDKELDEILKQIVELNLLVTKMYMYWCNYSKTLDRRFETMYQRLCCYINKIFGKTGIVYVTNPLTGKIEKLQCVLYDMCNAFNYGGLRAYEYDQLVITAKEYDTRQITAFQYDYNAKYVFFELLYLTMLSPFDGTRTPYKVIINQLANLHKNGLTASEYDDLNMEAETYDNKNISAYNYDWDGKNAVA